MIGARLTPRRHSALAAVVLVTVALLLLPASSHAARCHKVAAPGGADSAKGNKAHPYRTVHRLARSLKPGKVGCLRRGVYRERNVRINRGGRRGRPLTLRSYPGERAVLRGRIWITGRANHVKLTGLTLDGSRAPACAPGGTCRILPSPVVNGNFASFVGNRVTNRNRATCFNLGSNDYGRAIGTRIRRNRIHHCGRLPATNHDHGIYVQRADRTLISDNLIEDNADRGIQLYPDAQHTRIADNLIDGNGTGVQFSGASGVASNHNVVERSLITRSALHGIASWYPRGNPIGTGNLVRSGCIAGAGGSEVSGSSVAIAADVRIGSRCPPLTLVAGRSSTRMQGRVGFGGWVRGRHATAGPVSLRVQRGGRWVALRRIRVGPGGRYSARVPARKLRRRLQGRTTTVRLRAILPRTGASRPVEITLRR